MDKFLRLTNVTSTVGFAKSTIWKKVAEGKFPKPIKLSDRCTVWCESDVEAWMNEQIKQAKSVEVA